MAGQLATHKVSKVERLCHAHHHGVCRRDTATASPHWRAERRHLVKPHPAQRRLAAQWLGVGTIEQAFTGYAALPPAGQGTQQAWWQVLGLGGNLAGFEPQLAAAYINTAYKAEARKRHPDAGGSTEAMAALNVARDEGLKAVGLA